jgi:hypothetical protein
VSPCWRLFYIKAVLSSRLLHQTTSTGTMDFNTTTAAIEPTTVDSQVFSGVGHALRTAAIAALIFAVCAYFPKLKVRMQLAKLPRFDGETGQGTSSQNLLLSSKVLYSEGYERVRQARFQDTLFTDNCVVQGSSLPIYEFRWYNRADQMRLNGMH